MTPRAALVGLIALLVARVEGAALRFDHLRVEDGVSNSWVRDILRDRRGFVWIATMDGLNRYDGSRIVVYRPGTKGPGSLPSQEVGALFEDSRGRMWVGMGGTRFGLAAYDRRQDQFVAYDLGATDRPLQDIEEAEDGRLWLGTTAGLYLYDPVAARSTAFRHDSKDEGTLSDDDVLCLLKDRRGRLWVGTAGGLDRIEASTGKVTRWASAGREDAPLAQARIGGLYEDPAGILWVLTERGLYRIGTEGRAALHAAVDDATGLPSRPLRRLVGDGRTRLFVGSENAGLSVVDAISGHVARSTADTTAPQSLGSDSIWALHFDQVQDILWVGTFNAGVSYSSPHAQRFETVGAAGERVGRGDVSAVIEDRRGTLWIGTDGGGLHRFHRATGRSTLYRHDPALSGGLAANAVVALAEDEDGTIWIGTYAGGLQSLDPDTGRFRTFRHPPAEADRDNVWTILDNGGQLLVGSGAGVEVFDKDTGRFLSPAKGEPFRLWINAMASDRRGGLWLGSNQPVHLDRATGVQTVYDVRSEEVQAIHVDGRGEVWFGTKGAGLHRLPAGAHRTVQYSSGDGLPSDTVASILEDAAGNLWLGTDRGLVRAERTAGAGLRFTTFDTRDGLPSNEFRRGSAYRTAAGEMFFGTQRGLAVFSPHALQTNPYAPPALFTGLRASGHGVPLTTSITETDELVLAPRSTLTLEFATPTFVVPTKNRYRYRLRGFDGDWSPIVAKGTATYTNLPAGIYRFEVKGANNDGVWAEAVASLTLIQRPPFYQTVWFWMAAGALLSASAAALHRLRVRRHLRVEAELQARIRTARSQIRTLSGLFPVCTGCRKVRDDQGYWTQIEAYVSQKTDAKMSHGICPACVKKLYPHLADGTDGVS